MSTTHLTERRTNTREVDAFAASLLARAAGLRLPELFQGARPGAVSQVHDRGGVSVVVLGTAALTGREIGVILRYRLAQYLAAGFADARALFEAGVEREPVTSVSPTDIHVIAGDASTGEVLCYVMVRAVQPTSAGELMGSHCRPAFPVEEMHGFGIYDRLAHLPDLPVTKVREIGRFVKNHRHLAGELGIRAPVECLLALIRALAGPLRSQVDGLVGELEEGVVKRNLDFFNVPTVMIRGTVSHEASPWLCGHAGRTFYPFGVSIADFAAHVIPRAVAIERALEVSGRKGILELLALRRSAVSIRSSFEPAGGLPPLANVQVPHVDLGMPARMEMRRRGDALRELRPFDLLTTAEATVLRTFMARRRQYEGDVIVREGERTDALFVVEQGIAEVLVDGAAGKQQSLGRLGPGSCFGERALLHGIPEPAAVVARTRMRLLRLPGDVYRRYVATIGEVEAAFVSMANGQLTAAW